MADFMGKKLAHSLLATAGSLQGLEDELDRISLHSMSESGQGCTGNESPLSTGSIRHRQRRISRSSSKYDSAIGSLQSQTDQTTDEETVVKHKSKHSHKPKRKDKQAYSQSDWDWLYHTEQKLKHVERHTPKKRSKVKRRETDCSASSSTASTPVYRTKSHRQNLPEIPALEFLRREGSMQSLSSTDSYTSSNSSRRSSRVLDIKLSESDIHQIARLPSAQLKRTNSTVSDIVKPEEQHAEVIYIPPPTEDNDSVSSHSTIVGEEVQTLASELQDELTAIESETQPPLMPEIVVITAAPVEESTEHKPSAAPPSTNTLHANPNIPRRYSKNTGDWLKPSANGAKADQPPKRSASFLQRIKLRRGTSVKMDQRPKKRVPVRRSFSDRMMYQIRKGLVDYKEDTNFISNPSHLRRIGRMIDKQAGRFHIVQLHRQPNGRYGIYISESTLRRGIFVSRFADENAAKFYSGLIAPGDEIVKINKEHVKSKSVDYVYDRMAKMNSVVLTILPINSRPDW